MHDRVQQCVKCVCKTDGRPDPYFGPKIRLNQEFFRVYDLIVEYQRLRERILQKIYNQWRKFYEEATDREEVQSVFRRIITETIQVYLVSEERTKNGKDNELDESSLEYSTNSESEDDSEDIFCDISAFVVPKLQERYCTVEELVAWDNFNLEEILIQTMKTYFEQNDNFLAKAFALELYNFFNKISDKHVTDLIRMACEAISSKYERLIFNGHVILWKIIEEDLTLNISHEQFSQIFDVLNQGIVARPKSGLHLITAILNLAHNRTDSVDDNRLDQFIKNTLHLLAQPLDIFTNANTSNGRVYWSNFSFFGERFGLRIKQYLPLFKEAIIKLAGSAVKQHRQYEHYELEPFVTATEILHQYAVLGNKVLGENEFKPEIEQLVESVLDKSIGFEVNILEFQMQFGDVYIEVIKKNQAVLLKVFDTWLAHISKDLLQSGQFSVPGTDYFEHDTCPGFIPLTLNEYKSAIKKYQQSSKKLKEQEIFSFQSNTNLVDATHDSTESDLLNERGYDKSSYNEYANLASAKQLIKIYKEHGDKLSALQIQNLLWTLIGFIRARTREPSFYETVIELYEKISPTLSEEDKKKYLEVLSFVIDRMSSLLEVEDNRDRLLKPFQKIHGMTINFIEHSSPTTSTTIIERSFKYARKIAAFKHVQRKYPFPFLTLLKRLLKYSPRKVYRACRHAQISKMASNSKAEYYCTVAVLGYQFGVYYVKTLLPSTKLRQNFLAELHVACVNWLESNKTTTEEQIADVERFVVLLAACSINEELKHLCVYNSVLFDEKIFLSAIKNDKFDTKIKSLNERVKKWTSTKDMFDIDNL